MENFKVVRPSEKICHAFKLLAPRGKGARLDDEATEQYISYMRGESEYLRLWLRSAGVCLFEYGGSDHLDRFCFISPFLWDLGLRNYGLGSLATTSVDLKKGFENSHLFEGWGFCADMQICSPKYTSDDCGVLIYNQGRDFVFMAGATNCLGKSFTMSADSKMFSPRPRRKKCYNLEETNFEYVKIFGAESREASDFFLVPLLEPEFEILDKYSYSREIGYA